MNRLAIYARLGVPEVWCYDQGQLRIYLLQGSEYVLGGRSWVFPQLALEELPQIIETHRDRGRLALRRAVRAWVQAQVPEE